MQILKLSTSNVLVALALALGMDPAMASAAERTVILLWPNGAPGSEGKTAAEAVRISPEGDHVLSSIHRPSITAYLPPKDTATGTAVLIIPGGGHREIWIDHEGYRIAQWLSERGVAGFVLKYRLARESGSTYMVEKDSLGDVQRALRLVRSRASEWSIAPDRIGVMGFSAGGELAALVGIRYDAGSPGAPDAVDRESSRPAFQALIYPAIPSDEIAKLSKDTPPAFLLCGADDRPDISQGLPELFTALRRAGVSAELHVFAGVGHGFGLRDSNHGPIAEWLKLFYGWLEQQGLLERK